MSETNWLLKSILEYSNTSLPMLDVGGGYGSLTLKMLEQCASVILDDMEIQHLKIARNSIDPLYWPNFLKQ